MCSSLAVRLNEALHWSGYLNPASERPDHHAAADLQLHEWDEFIDADLTHCQVADCRLCV